MITIKGQRYLQEKELSSKYGFSIHWFRHARYENNGPAYHKLNNKVYYREDQVDDWFKENLKPHE